MKRALYAVALLAMVAIAGCEDSPTDPANEAIMGGWTATRVGDGFPGATPKTLTLQFESGGDLGGTLNGQTIDGTYSTSGSSTSSDIRGITMSLTTPVTMTFTGIYQINGTEMQLEVAPSGVATVTPPDAAAGFGSTKVNGQAQGNAYISMLAKN